MKLAATLYTGIKSQSDTHYVFVYRNRIDEDGTQIIDSIESYLNADISSFGYNYKGDDIIENMNRDTEIITEDVWQEYCDELTKYLTENNIINFKTQDNEEHSTSPN